MQHMLGDVYVRADAIVARLHGDIDLVNVDVLRKLLDDVCAGPSPRIVVDLTDVEFIDVLSLAVVLGAADGLREMDRELVVEGASNAVKRLCVLLNAEDILAPAEAPQIAIVLPAC
jgi:anti-anti-sigma factor